MLVNYTCICRITLQWLIKLRNNMWVSKKTVNYSIIITECFTHLHSSGFLCVKRLGFNNFSLSQKNASWLVFMDFLKVILKAQKKNGKYSFDIVLGFLVHWNTILYSSKFITSCFVTWFKMPTTRVPSILLKRDVSDWQLGCTSSLQLLT